MGLETGNYIADLEQAWPLDGDFIEQGDDHIRLIKKVLQATFPGGAGAGFTKAITASEDELNYCDGVTAPIQDQIDAINASTGQFPVGTFMIFRQAGAPPGWVKADTNADAMLRNVVDGGGAGGGSDSPIGFNWAHTHTTGSYALVLNDLPAALNSQLQINMGPSSQSDDHSRENSTARGNADGPIHGGGAVRINNFTGDQAHNHGSTGSSGNVWSPKYVNVITAYRAV